MFGKSSKTSKSVSYRVLPCVQLDCKKCSNSVFVYVPPDTYSEDLIRCTRCNTIIPLEHIDIDNHRTSVYIFENSNICKDKTNKSHPNKQLPATRRDTGKETRCDSPTSVNTSNCDVCSDVLDLAEGHYCRFCLQKLCRACLKVHDNLTASTEHHTEPSWAHAVIFDTEQIKTLLGPCEEPRIYTAAYLEEETGLQVCLRPECDIEVLAPFKEIYDLINTHFKGFNGALKEDGVSLRLGGGRIQWLFVGYRAKIVRTIFKDEIEVLVESYPDVSMSYTDDWEEENAPKQDYGENVTEEMKSDKYAREVGQTGKRNITKWSVLKLSSSFDLYPIVKDFIEDIDSKIDGMYKVEVARAKKDEFRVKIYAMMKERDENIVCTEEKNETAVKLVIRGQDQGHVQDTKQEFLSLFCKECSVCRAESAHPMYLECKHVLCHECVTKAIRHNDGMKCHACCDAEVHVTPVPSLQVHCIDRMDEIYTPIRSSKPTKHMPNASKKSERKKVGNGKQQFSTKVPKYLLQKWSRQTGGLTRLRSLIENNYGFQTGGPDDNMKIYGQKYELLDLAIQSIENLKEKPTEHGVTCRIADNMVEWRFRGDHSRIVYFLFGKELTALSHKFKSVTIKSFTDFQPPVVDIKCSYEEYTEMKYQIDELLNVMMFLHEDEYIQPKSFYYNIKVKEFLRSKRTDENVFCELRDKNNRNVIIIKARKKKYINITKDQIANW